MRAAVLHEPGAAPRCTEIDDAVAGEGQVLIRVTAAAVSPIDRLVASGASYFGTPPVPYVPGMHGVGVTPDGTRVWFATGAGIGGTRGGSLAELVAVRPEQTLALPDGDDVVAVALGHSAIAAVGALRRGGLAAGQTVVVLGANGVVGQIGLQMARIAGARVVAVARGDDALARATELGAAAVVDSTTDDVESLAAAMAEACGGAADLVLDPVWGVPAAAALRTVRPHGRLVNLGDSAGAVLPLPSALLRSRSLEIIGWTNATCSWDEQGAILVETLAHAATGAVVVDVETAPLEDVEDAWGRRTQGRMVLLP